MMNEIKKITYSLHVIFHPFDGFWDLKHEKRGSLRAAIVLYCLLAISVLIKRQLTAYLYNPNDVENLNIFRESAIAVAPYILWCISNWCFTSLMDGEGRMSDIIIATAYALTPLIIFNILTVIFSRVLALEEQSFILLMNSISVVWAYFLIFISMLVTHQYTVRKSLLTAVLSVVGMGVIVFLGLLVFYLVQQVVGFGLEVYRELSFRWNE